MAQIKGLFWWNQYGDDPAPWIQGSAWGPVTGRSRLLMVSVRVPSALAETPTSAIGIAEQAVYEAIMAAASARPPGVVSRLFDPDDPSLYERIDSEIVTTRDATLSRPLSSQGLHGFSRPGDRRR